MPRETEVQTTDQELEPVNPKELEASLKRGLDQAKAGTFADVSQVKGLEWLNGG